jgi:hypothetical protein
MSIAADLGPFQRAKALAAMAATGTGDAPEIDVLVVGEQQLGLREPERAAICAPHLGQGLFDDFLELGVVTQP